MITKEWIKERVPNNFNIISKLWCYIVEGKTKNGKYVHFLIYRDVTEESATQTIKEELEGNRGI